MKTDWFNESIKRLTNRYGRHNLCSRSILLISDFSTS
ncbi:Uncharacterized protein APZ42_001686 [Daphnia magna]|uniref:Uncharacterized protein n=1 Tax=Daphnia magna TaxID=35525 RepID=A0A164ITT6_9CRUS|nr:Uncharacterized protein APZ42_001686 [Daphnia magna]